MLNTLLFLLGTASTAWASVSPTFKAESKPVKAEVALVQGALGVPYIQSLHAFSYQKVERMLRAQTGLSEPVISKVLTSLQCAQRHRVMHSQILTIIDYSLPSNQKRMWVFNLRDQRLMYHTYVSHGIKSGARDTNFFSNTYNSRASSIGVYRTKKAYYGREGLSLQLAGLDYSFNDNAENRAIVMHGGWYVDEDFIKKYGRAGRSWGCPALPTKLSSSIINQIKDASLMVVYYPSDRWFSKSRFLQCGIAENAPSQPVATLPEHPAAVDNEPRGPIVFAALKPHAQWRESDPLLVLSADGYKSMMNQSPPVGRMLRRQMQHVEYVVLNPEEMALLTQPQNKKYQEQLRFVVPEIVQVRGGYYETLMKPVPLGVVKDITPDPTGKALYLIQVGGHQPIEVRVMDQFIRWVGL